MNSEELELSLRTEFESHLKSVLAEMRQEFSNFQEKIEAEFDKHKSQLDAVFQDFSTRLETEKEYEEGFKETVVEHLRLARDEGARISAMAFAEAEEMEKEFVPPPQQPAPLPSVGLSELRDAINDITAQSSQATILKQLVHHAGQFTPRGAFFIIKNEHFVGWRVFGKEESGDDEAVREIFLPVASSTVLGESVRSLSATESSFGTYEDDADYLDKLEFGQPERMISIPLVARGRGVAVLYADTGKEGEAVNVEALETLVRVAGLTVEVLASSQGVKAVQDYQPAVDYSEETASVEAQEEVSESEFAAVEDSQADEQVEHSEEAKFSEEVDSAAEQPDEQMAETDYQSEVESRDFSEQSEVVTDDFSARESDEAEEISATPAWSQTDEDETITLSESDIQVLPEQDSPSDYTAPAGNDYRFEDAPVDSAENLSAEKGFESFESDNGKEDSFVPEPAVSEPVSAAPVKSRFSDRNVDLPIEVGEDERRLHNDARRFARLLVSEIKLYNEQKVKEGREAQDLYERLREAIDRSRDMYDKRVQPPVAAKFDYFHYELVSSLAEGEETRLGGGYPGAAI